MSYRLVFMGTPDFAKASLEALLKSRHEVVAVVSQPDKAVGRGKKLQSPPVAALAKEKGIPLLQVSSTKSLAFRKWLGEKQADFGIVAAFGHILGEKALATPKYGCINVHASLLPRWRGASPIQMAVLAGDEEAGISIMQMDKGMDTGPVFHQEALRLHRDETAESLHQRLAELGGKALIHTLDKIEKGLESTPQGDEGVTMAPLFQKSDGNIDWQDDAETIERKIRAFHPWPGTYTFFLDGPLEGTRLRLLPKAEVVDIEGEPGKILRAEGDAFFVACGKKSLALGMAQLENKKAMDVKTLLQGRDGLLGAYLGSKV